jgi:hypothetical protein
MACERKGGTADNTSRNEIRVAHTTQNSQWWKSMRWISLIGYKKCLCKGETNLTKAKSGRISFFDVLSASSILTKVLDKKEGVWELFILLEDCIMKKCNSAKKS